MKKLNLLFVFGLIVSQNVQAQFELPIIWETVGEDTAWNVFANGAADSSNFVIVDNPDKTGINSSDSCLKFTVLDAADPWAGAYSDYYGEIALTEDNHIMQMMVNKNVITPITLKLEIGTTASPISVDAENTVTDEWELITFDFTEFIGESYTRLTFFPDFPSARTAGSICYIDNIGFYFEPSSINENNQSTVKVFPNPTHDYLTVISKNLIESVHIYDFAGKSVKSFNGISDVTAKLEISNLNSGLYLAKIKDNQGNTESKKIVVK
ncbi:MAG: T9SS type A sorting domain-containing protein [Salinivirgaceae bacterium]